MKTIKERIWKKATTELNPKFQDTKRNFEYEEPIIDLTLKEVLELIDEVMGGTSSTYGFARGWEEGLKELKKHLG